MACARGCARSDDPALQLAAARRWWCRAGGWLWVLSREPGERRETGKRTGQRLQPATPHPHTDHTGSVKVRGMGGPFFEIRLFLLTHNNLFTGFENPFHFFLTLYFSILACFPLFQEYAILSWQVELRGRGEQRKRSVC